MSNNSSSAGVGGISFGALLFLVFLVLKLTSVIDWSWWWVTAPLWIHAAICLLLLIILGIAKLIFALK